MVILIKTTVTVATQNRCNTVLTVVKLQTTNIAQIKDNQYSLDNLDNLDNHNNIQS